MHDLVMRKAKNVKIAKIVLRESHDYKRVAYAMVELEDPKSVKVVRRAFRDHWEQDSKIKVITKDDVENEAINNRTLALMNLPSHVKANDLAKIFAEHGAITLIDCPTVDNVIRQQMKDKGYVQDHFEK